MATPLRSSHMSKDFINTRPLGVNSLSPWSSSRSWATIYPREGAAMRQIADWLESRGVSEYAERFAEKILTQLLRH